MAAIQHRAGHRRRALAEINVVPYIDVMLVLLIIFMVTAPLIAPSVVKLPTVGQASRAPDVVIEVDLRADHSLSVQLRGGKGGPGLQQQAVTVDELPAALGQLATAQGSTLAAMPVLIAADRDVKYDDVMHVLDRLKQDGVQRVGLAVQASGR